MNTQTQNAYETLMNDRSGKLISDASREFSTESLVRTVDCETAEEARELELKVVAGRLAWKVGQVVARSEWPGFLSTDSQMSKVSFIEICRAWYCAWDARRDADEAALLAR